MPTHRGSFLLPNSLTGYIPPVYTHSKCRAGFLAGITSGTLFFRGFDMARFDDSLRGYGHPTMKRDEFICSYCGLDGKASFSYWLSLSIDHLLPKGHPNRDNPDYITTACMFCNTADNQYFYRAKERGLRFNGLSRKQLIDQRRPYVENVRRGYRDFWKVEVKTP